MRRTSSKRIGQSASVVLFVLSDASSVCLLGFEFVFTVANFESRALLPLAPDISTAF